MVSIKLFVKTILLLTIILVIKGEAQNNPVYKMMKQRGWISPIEAKLGKLSPDQYQKEEFISMGYDDNTIKSLKKEGVDLTELHNNNTPLSIKDLASLSDCIIIGTVKKIEHPFKKRSWFQTLVFVQVEKYLRNDYDMPLKVIPILIVSSRSKTLVGEDTLGLGEHVLLFLSASGLIRFASNNHMSDLYKKLINDSTVTFEILVKYEVRLGKAISLKKQINLNDVQSDIKKINYSLQMKQ